MRILATPVNDLYQECKSSTPGLFRMLKDERSEWEPVFHDVVEQTLDGGQAALDEIKTRPELPAQAQETALAFLEGGLTAGCFGALTAWTFQSAVLRESIAGEAEKLRQQLHTEGPEALRATLTAEQEKGRAVYARSTESSQDFRGLMQEAFVIGYRVGAAEALIVLV